MQHISNLLKKFEIVNELTKKIAQLEQIKALIANFLPNDLAKNCMVANLRAEVLVIVTNSPVWKYQLNFLKMDLLQHLRNSSVLLAGISSISIVIDYFNENLSLDKDNTKQDPSLAVKKSPKNFQISKENVRLINEIISVDIQNKQLKTAFKKLITKINQL